MLLLITFASLALILAVVGIYGVMSYAVTQRTQEIGIRMALGARRPAILMMVLRTGMVLTLIGAALGLVGAFVLTRWMSSMLFGVTASDPSTYATVLLVSLGEALLACSIPARRATRVDPLVALRYE
jgi:putative ABC transport system permease protein